jgi:transposase-like protein
MGRSYAPEFRHRVVQRVRSGRSVKKVAAEVGAAEATVFRWVAQDKVDRGERSGTSSRNRTALARAHRPNPRTRDRAGHCQEGIGVLQLAGHDSPKRNSR